MSTVSSTPVVNRKPAERSTMVVMGFCSLLLGFLPRTWRREIRLVSICVGLVIGALSAQAAPEYQPFSTTTHPGSMGELDIILDPNGRPEMSIPANLDEAICGGWDMKDKVTNLLGGKTGKIAKVWGVPGREGEPVADPDFRALGMAKRKEQFIYPSDTSRVCGFTTACRPPRGSGSYAEPNTGYRRIPGSTPYDLTVGFFAGPTSKENPLRHPCERGLDGCRSDITGDELPDEVRERCKTSSPLVGGASANIDITYSCGGGKMEDVIEEWRNLRDAGKPAEANAYALTGFCSEMNIGIERDDVNFMGLSEEDKASYEPPPLTEDTTGGICQKLNEDWVYTLWRQWRWNGTVFLPSRRIQRGDCRAFDKTDIADKTTYGLITTPISFWKRDGVRYCCTDGEYQGPDKNCKPCYGQECEPHEVMIENPWGRDRPVNHWSFFRRYVASYFRNKVRAVVQDSHSRVAQRFRDDNVRERVPVACYGLYSPIAHERDAKVTNIGTRYRRCVIASYYPFDTPWEDQYFWLKDNSPTADFEKQMEYTQEGKGKYTPQKRYPDPAVNDPVRKVYDQDEDLWSQEIADAFSMINPHQLEERYDDNLTFALFALDNGRQRATVQRTVDMPLSSGGLIRASDDTVADINRQRTIEQWWNELQTNAHTYFAAPVVRLVLPPPWAVDLDPLHPLLTPAKLSDTQSPDWLKNPLLQPVEVQLELREDLLGEVAQYLTDAAIVNIQEEPITVVVPLGSPTEYRAQAQGWCRWWMSQQNSGGEEDDKDKEPVKDCSEIDGIAEKMHHRLLQYARRIEQYRTLRADMSRILAAYLDVHTGLNRTMGQWVLDNAEQYHEYLEEREERLAMKWRWERAQQLYRQFHDDINMPWCKNDNFTTSVYSLLDPWWPGGGGQERDLLGEELPRFEEVESQPDLRLDFTQLTFSSGALRLPVLKPIQLRLSEASLAAPSIYVDDPPHEEPPDLPPIPSIASGVIVNMPKASTGSKTPDNLNDLLDDLQIDLTEDLDEVEKVLQSTESTVRRMGRDYRKFWDSILVDPEDVDDWEDDKWTQEDCLKPDNEVCLHFENDLIERFTRIGARPAVMLREDFDIIGSFRDPVSPDPRDHCNPDDWTCQQINPQNTYPRQGWMVAGPGAEEQAEFIGEIRRETIEDSIFQDPDDVLPYTFPLKETLPSFSVPSESDLRLSPTDFLAPTP